MKNQVIQLLSLATLLISCSASVNAKESDSKGPVKPKSTKSATSKLSENAALELIKNRAEVKEFFANVNKAKTAKPVIEVDRKEGSCYVIHVYELVPDGPDSSHTATMNWYNVDFNTKKVTKEF